MRKTSIPVPVLVSAIVIIFFSNSYSDEVNCFNGSSLSGIDGLDIEVICNPLAEEVLFHRSLVRDYAIKHLADAGIALSEQLRPGSGMISISVATVETTSGSGPATLATTLNIDLNRASLCLLEDDEFHAIASIVWEEDRLIVSSEPESREIILEILNESLERLAGDLRNADPGKYSVSSLGPVDD